MDNLAQDIVKFLTPLPCFSSESQRRAVLLRAGLSDLLPSVNLSGSASECVASILYNFEQYGQADELRQLLQEVQNMVGKEKKIEIQRFLDALRESRPFARPSGDARPAASTPVPQMNVYGGNVHIHHGDERMETKYQFNNQIQNMQGNLIQGSSDFTIEQKFNAQTPQEFAALLAELQKKIAQLPLPEDQKEEIAHEVKTAEIQAKKPQPDKPKMAAALDNAKTVLQKIGETVPQAVAIGKLVGKAIDYVSGLL